MLRQGWVMSGPARFCRVHRIPETVCPIGTAILFAGFSHPMCDVDRFMSRLAAELCANDYLAVQIDPRGHGDSSGDLGEVTMETLRHDVDAIIGHYYSRTMSPVVVIGRGLAATVLAEHRNDTRVRAIGGVSPYMLEPGVACALAAGDDPRGADAFRLFPYTDYYQHSDFPLRVRDLFDHLGALAYNLHGDRISLRLLEELSDYNAVAAVSEAAGDDNLWLRERFERTPAFQYRAVAQFCAWAKRCGIA